MLIIMSKNGKILDSVHDMDSLENWLNTCFRSSKNKLHDYHYFFIAGNCCYAKNVNSRLSEKAQIADIKKWIKTKRRFNAT